MFRKIKAAALGVALMPLGAVAALADAPVTGQALLDQIVGGVPVNGIVALIATFGVAAVAFRFGGKGIQKVKQMIGWT